MRPTRPDGGPSQSQAGFSLAELAILLAVIGVLFSLSLPAFITYYQSAQLRGAAAAVAAYVNHNRQLPIQLNCSFSVVTNPTAIQYIQGGNCPTPGVWKGSGTDAGGNIPLSDGITLPASATPVFKDRKSV